MKMRQANYLDNQASNQFSYEAQKCLTGIFTLDRGETASICGTKQSQMTIKQSPLSKCVGSVNNGWHIEICKEKDLVVPKHCCR